MAGVMTAIAPGTSESNDDFSQVTVIGVLKILADAGDTGELASLVARRFNTGQRVQMRNTYVNDILRRLAAREMTRRSDRTEPSPVYHNVPAYRWFITAAGRGYLASNGHGGFLFRVSAAKAEAERQRQITAAARLRILKAAPALAAVLPAGCSDARRNLIIKLRSHNLTLAEIGTVLGISYERVRQIIAGIGVRPCECPLHGKRSDLER